MAFIDGEQAVAEAAEGFLGLLVAGFVAAEFGEPVAAVGGGHSASAAGVHVPEAAGDVDDCAQPGEEEVGSAGEGFDVEVVAEGVNDATVAEERRGEPQAFAPRLSASRGRRTSS